MQGRAIYSTGEDEFGNRIYPKKGEPGHPDTKEKHLVDPETGLPKASGSTSDSSPVANYTGLSID